MTIQLGGRDYDIYGHSHLSYGATLMAKRVPEYLIKENPYASVIVNPCMLRGKLLETSDFPLKTKFENLVCRIFQKVFKLEPSYFVY